MLIEIYLFFELIVIILFFMAYFKKSEIIWAMVILLSGVLMMSSYDIEYKTYVYNNAISAYSPTIVGAPYPYMMGINLLFCGLGILFLIWDIWMNYKDGISEAAKDPNMNDRGLANQVVVNSPAPKSFKAKNNDIGDLSSYGTGIYKK